MTALEKVKFLQKTKEKQGYGGQYFLDIRARESRWQSGELDSLKKEYPWLPSFYLDFLKEFDTLGLSWVSFFGSEGNNILPIQKELTYWKTQMKGKYFPFGKDVDGSIYAFNKDGNVIYFSCDDYEWEKPEYVAVSLEDFIGDCLLGHRFKEFNNVERSKFYPFLKDQGWA